MYGSKPQLAAVRRGLRVSVKRSVEKAARICEVSGEWWVVKPFILKSNPRHPGHSYLLWSLRLGVCDCRDWQFITVIGAFEKVKNKAGILVNGCICHSPPYISCRLTWKRYVHIWQVHIHMYVITTRTASALAISKQCLRNRDYFTWHANPGKQVITPQGRISASIIVLSTEYIRYK